MAVTIRRTNPGATDGQNKKQIKVLGTIWEVGGELWKIIREILDKLDPPAGTGRPRTGQREALNGIIRRWRLVLFLRVSAPYQLPEGIQVAQAQAGNDGRASALTLPLASFTVSQMFRVTRHGIREMLVGSIILAVIALLLWNAQPPLVVLVVPVWSWLIAFFRDPERAIPSQPDLMVSPADGKVTDIVELPHVELLGGPAVRVGIFLSVFNVHVNRSPCDGTVTAVRYQRGKFINAMNFDHASEQNESNTLVLCDPANHQPIAVVKQIVGLIARRIVCTAAVGDTLQRGQRFGMIKFGSRTELYIAKSLQPQIHVSIGQKVRGAIDVIAVLGNPVGSAQATAARAERTNT
ncbi:MAG: phosphatidylserine decarboxylase [Planctomycetota bacterium]|nr:phosphatidylserine decarboxylase [Planctomycetota bacterium]